MSMSTTEEGASTKMETEVWDSKKQQMFVEAGLKDPATQESVHHSQFLLFLTHPCIPSTPLHTSLL